MQVFDRARHVAAHLPRSMPLRVRALHIAARFVGVAEHGENRGHVIDQIITAAHGSLGEAYCGDFVELCYALAGSKAINRNWAAASYVGPWMRVTHHPLPGDKVYFNFDHTGLFSHWLGHGRFQTIEGNSGDGRPGYPTGGILRHDDRTIDQVAHFVHILR
jgi:hypothetical protein